MDCDNYQRTVIHTKSLNCLALKLIEIAVGVLADSDIVVTVNIMCKVVGRVLMECCRICNALM